MFYEILFSPQVKRSAIISSNHNIYTFPQELPHDLRLRILGNQERSEKSQHLIEL